jgi:hypothetical protein
VILECPPVSRRSGHAVGKTNPLLRDEEGTPSPCLSLQWLRDDQRFDLVTEWDRAIATVLRATGSRH